MVEDIGVLTPDMIGALRCPICAAPLSPKIPELARQSPGFGPPDRELARRVPGSWGLVCEQGHSFDVARQGYVHLGAGRKLPDGDTAAMVEAREAVLPLFAPLTEKLAQSVPTSARLIVDLGGGTGYHLSRVLDRLRGRERRSRGPQPDHRPGADRGETAAADESPPGAQGMVFDVSKPALKRAARRVGAVLADTWGRLPLADQSVDAVLNVFAPRNGPETRRVLRDLLIVATPLPHHLIELRQALGLLDVDPSKEERLARTLLDFELASDDHLEWTLDLDAAQAAQIVAMGPNAFHGPVEGRAMRTTAAVRVTTWRGRPLPSRPADRDAGR